MDVREKLVELCEDLETSPCCDTYEGQADYLIAHGVTVQEWISVDDRLPDNKQHDWVLAQVVEDSGFMHIPKVMEYRQSKNDWFEEKYELINNQNNKYNDTK